MLLSGTILSIGEIEQEEQVPGRPATDRSAEQWFRQIAEGVRSGKGDPHQALHPASDSEWHAQLVHRSYHVHFTSKRRVTQTLKMSPPFGLGICYNRGPEDVLQALPDRPRFAVFSRGHEKKSIGLSSVITYHLTYIHLLTAFLSSRLSKSFLRLYSQSAFEITTSSNSKRSAGPPNVSF